MNQRRLKVLAISGSMRRDSYNRKALRVSKRFAQEAGAEVDEIDLKELKLPIFDQDIIKESGIPDEARKLKMAVEAADVLLIASPEYNYSIPAGLKNAIDWASRKPNSFNGKVAAIFGASTGRYGTIRMQPHLRQVLVALNVLVLPQPQVHIGHAPEAFSEDGSLRDKRTEDQLKMLVVKSLSIARALRD